MTTAIAKHDAHIAELREKVFTLECSQQTCILEKLDDIRESLRDDIGKAVTALMKPLMTKVNLFDTVLQNLVTEQKKMTKDIAALTFEDHSKMCKDILNLQQTISIMKRKRLHTETIQHKPLTALENVQLVQLRSLQQTPVAATDAVDIAATEHEHDSGDKKQALEVRVSEVVERLDILNHMHRNLRAELAEMNLVHA